MVNLDLRAFVVTDNKYLFETFFNICKNKNIDKILSQNYESFFPENNGNYNSIKDFQKLCQIDLNEKLTFKEAIDRLRALSHQPFKNAYFIDSNNNKIYLRLELLKETIEQ